jgi:Flp pilus assembly protein TadD
VLILAGRAMLLANHAANAEAYFSRAVELAPSNPEALSRLEAAKKALGRLRAP